MKVWGFHLKLTSFIFFISHQRRATVSGNTTVTVIITKNVIYYVIHKMATWVLYSEPISYGPQCGDVHERGKSSGPEQMSDNAVGLHSSRRWQEQCCQGQGHHQATPGHSYRYWCISYIQDTVLILIISEAQLKL